MHGPTAIVVEKTYPHPLPWLHRLHRLTLSARRIARRSHAAFAQYAPQTVRKSLVGSGWANKPEVALAVAHRFPQLRVHLTQDRRWKESYWHNMFDAVALAIHHQRAQHPPSRGR
jgi:Holliday junction resolvasome RuvABC endonuclease subunit